MMKVVFGEVVFEGLDTYMIIDAMNMSECFNFFEFCLTFSHHSNI
jgi:hypothetical protein